MINLNSLTPQQKALCSVGVLLVSSFVGAALVALIITYGLFLYVGYAMILYGVFGLLRMVYDIQLEKFKTEAEKKVDI